MLGRKAHGPVKDFPEKRALELTYGEVDISQAGQKRRKFPTERTPANVQGLDGTAVHCVWEGASCLSYY